MNAINLPAASSYPMRVVARLTGLSSHTIRVWERRYGAVSPARSSGNTRQFSAADVRRLSLLAQATRQGHRIKDIANLAESDLDALLINNAGDAQTDFANPTAGDALQQVRRDYLDAISRFDGRRASDILGRAAALLRPKELTFKLILPLLAETGDRWEGGDFSVAHEHLVTHHVRGLLDTLLRFHEPQPGAPRLVVATPPGHLHEFGVLAGTLIAAARGFDPVYLGPNVPEQDLRLALERSKSEVLLLGLIRHQSDAETDELYGLLARLSADYEVWVGLPPDHPDHGSVDGVHYLDSFANLDLLLTERASRAN